MHVLRSRNSAYYPHLNLHNFFNDQKNVNAYIIDFLFVFPRDVLCGRVMALLLNPDKFRVGLAESAKSEIEPEQILNGSAIVPKGSKALTKIHLSRTNLQPIKANNKH